MKSILFFLLFLSFEASSSVVGISTHPLNPEARVFSAEMTGYMSQRNEMGAGLRYTQELGPKKLFDVSASGGQDSRGFTIGAGMDFELLPEDMNQPRVSIKPFWQQQRFDDENATVLVAAPSLRKGVSLQGMEFFPYLSLPNGISIDSNTDEFIYYSSLTLGASMPFPGAENERLLLSIEGNKNLGASSDYLGCLVSWMWN